MLKSFRSNATVRKWIIYIIVLLLAAYVLVGFGSAPVGSLSQGDTVASLGSTDIKVQDAMIQLEENKRRYGQADKDMIDGMTADQLITSAIMIDQADKLDVVVSDQELIDMIVQARTLPDGTFISDEDWASRIKNVFNVQVRAYEQFQREHQLRVRKLYQLFQSSVYVSEKDIKDRFAKDNEKVTLELVSLMANDVRSEVKLEKDEDYKALLAENQDLFKSGEQRKVKFVSISYKTFEDGAPTDAEVEAEYKANIERYKQPESLKASHVLIKTEKHTEAEAEALAKKIKAELDGGLDFAEAAKKYSEDEANKDRGGDLGNFSRGRMVKAFEDAAFALADQAVSEPVKTEFGYHIIKRMEYRAEQVTPLEQVKGSIVNVLTRNKTKAKALEVANNFHNLLGKGKSFDEAASELKLEVQVSDFFDNDPNSDMGAVLKVNFNVRKAAFELADINAYSDPIALGLEAVVLQYVEKGEPRNLTFETDTNRVKQLCQTVAGNSFIKKELAKIREEALAAPAKSIKDICASRSWIKENQIKTTTWVDANTIPYEIRYKDLDFSKDIYSLSPGQFLANIETDSENRYSLTRVVERQEVDATKLDEQRPDIVERIRQEKGGDLFAEFLFSKRNTLDPKGEARTQIIASLNAR